MNIDNKMVESKVNLNNSKNSPRTLAELENTLLGSDNPKPSPGSSIQILSFGSARFTSKSFNSKIKAAEEISSVISSLQLSPKTLARVENTEMIIKSFGQASSVQVMSVGNHRIGRPKNNYEEIVSQVKVLAGKEIEEPLVGKQFPHKTLSEVVLQSLKKVLDNDSPRENRYQNMKAFLSIVTTISHYDNCPSLLDDVFKNLEETEGWGQCAVISKPEATVGEKCPTLGNSEKNYIEEQAELFRKSFDVLYKDYPEQYILFHNGEGAHATDVGRCSKEKGMREFSYP